MIKEALESYVDAMNQLAEMKPGFTAPTHAHDFVLAHGEIWLGQKLPGKYRLRPIKQCFRNTWDLVRRSKALTYVEGFVISRELPMPFHHAWAVNRKNEVIDTTLRAWADLSASGGDRGHYMGVRFPTEFVKQRFHGSMLDHPYHGLRLDVIRDYEEAVCAKG